MVIFKDFSRPLSVFQVLFKVNFIFKDFQDSPVYSSTFQACANPVKGVEQKNNFLISQPKHNYVVVAQKNRLNETVLLITQNIC